MFEKCAAYRILPLSGEKKEKKRARLRGHKASLNAPPPSNVPVRPGTDTALASRLFRLNSSVTF